MVETGRHRRMPNVGVVVGTWMDALMQASNMGTFAARYSAHESRRRRGCDVDIPRRQVGAAAAETWLLGRDQRSPAGTKSDFPNIQNWGDPVKSWGWGTFYAHAPALRGSRGAAGVELEGDRRRHDSNAVDKRCIMKEFAPGQCTRRRRESADGSRRRRGPQTGRGGAAVAARIVLHEPGRRCGDDVDRPLMIRRPGIYDCPGGFLSTSCDASQAWVWTDDASKLGAGSYPAGVHGGGGGGAGCHYDSKWIDQYGMETGKFPSLTGDVNCQRAACVATCLRRGYRPAQVQLCIQRPQRLGKLGRRHEGLCGPELTSG